MYFRLWAQERRRTSSWYQGHQNLWKRPKRWQLVIFCILWGVILIAFLVAAILNLK
jgi:hypothetical protein